METKERKPPASARGFAGAAGFVIATALLLTALPASVAGGEKIYPRHTRENFRHNLAATVRADHPAIVPVAAAIRAVTRNPLEQLVMVNDVTHLLVDYDDDERVFGVADYHATLDEMLERRREGGWLYLRDDCDGRAVFAAHLLAALGIEWRFEASYWKEHAWVIARVGGVDYDLLDLRLNAPETDRFSYQLFGHFFVRESHRPPPFAWRRAWAERTGSDLTAGLELGMLAIDSTPGHLHQRWTTDWTERSPGGKNSPPETRATPALIAGFPYGETLHPAALVASAPKPVPPAGGLLGGATSSRANTAK